MEVAPERRTGTHRRARAPARAPLVLLADDSEGDRLLCAAYLERCSLHVAHAVDGEHALLKILQLAPAVVVMNLDWEALREMHAHPKLREIPVIALTDDLSDANAHRAHALGACAVLPKPCAPLALHAILSEVLDRVGRDRS